MQVLQKRLQMLEHLLQDLHITVDVGLELADFSLLCDYFLSALSLALQAFRESLYLCVLVFE